MTMVFFEDGPAANVVLELDRTPVMLRVVHNPQIVKGKGRWDALDQLDDTPEPHEQVYVYRVVPGSMCAAMVDGPKFRGRCSVCRYALWSEQPPENVLRDNALWAEYCEALQKLENDL